MQKVGDRAIMVFRKHIRQCAAEVPEESIADIGAAYDPSGERGKIWSGIISTALLELFDHLIRPVLHSRFPTIHGHVADGLSPGRPERLGMRIGIAVEIAFDILATELVDFISEPAWSGRAVFGAGERISEAQNRPPSRRDIPRKRSVFRHL